MSVDTAGWAIEPDRSVAVMLCTFRTCSWQSPDVRTLGDRRQADIAREHLLTVHREQLAQLAEVAAAGAGNGWAPRPRWSAVDGDTRAHLVDAEATGALVLVVETEHDRMTVRLPDAALRRGARATAEYLIERAHVSPAVAAQVRRDLDALTERLP